MEKVGYFEYYSHDFYNTSLILNLITANDKLLFQKTLWSTTNREDNFNICLFQPRQILQNILQKDEFWLWI